MFLRRSRLGLNYKANSCKCKDLHLRIGSIIEVGFGKAAMRSSSVDLIILEVLRREQAHLTSQEVYRQIRDRLPAVNPSTVYRALDRLARRGKISVSDIGAGSAVYEAVGRKAHHHLVCQKCRQVFALSNEEVGRFFSRVEQDHQFQITTNHLILFGICRNCQETGAEAG